MPSKRTLITAGLLGLLAAAPPAAGQQVRLSTATLQDRIRGGWAGQTIGVTFGGPTEFVYTGTMIQDYQPIVWYDGYLKDTYDTHPGLYDDLYVDLTFVDVIEREGLDAPAREFAKALSGAGYQLWFANQMARYNYRNGLEPPASGNWLHNPEADAIDFQIEADFAGLMSPGLPREAAEISDRVGHVMNSGDGWYGGVYVATLYSLAFVSDDVEQVVREALTAIPEQSTFHQTIADVIRWHEQYPDDWRRTWFEIQKKWSSDVGSPSGVFRPFDIDAKVNAAYVVLGLLYGQGDFGRTITIAARAGQDSDCNPSTAGGVLGAMLGYSRIPAYWKQGLAEVEPIDFKYTTISLNDVYGLSYKHALQVIRRAGGTVGDGFVLIPRQTPRPVRLEQNFTGHFPIERRGFGAQLKDEFSFEFSGIGFAIDGAAVSTDRRDHVVEVEMYIDGAPVERVSLPTDQTARRFIPFWRYQLPDGKHTVRLEVLNPTGNAYVRLNHAILYGRAPAAPQS
jgi:hypothetical protein